MTAKIKKTIITSLGKPGEVSRVMSHVTDIEWTDNESVQLTMAILRLVVEKEMEKRNGVHK